LAAGLAGATEEDANMAMAAGVGGAEVAGEYSLSNMFRQMMSPRNVARAAGATVGAAGMLATTPTDARGGTPEFYARNAKVGENATANERVSAMQNYKPQTIGEMQKQEMMQAAKNLGVFDLMPSMQNNTRARRQTGSFAPDKTFSQVPDIKLPWMR